MFKLCTIQNIRDRSRSQSIGVDFDTLLGQLIDEVTVEFAQAARRPDWDKAARTVFLSPEPEIKRLFLASPPIAASPVITVHESTAVPRVYGANELLTVNDDYFVSPEEGMIVKGGMGLWASGPKVARVVYTGGLLTADGAGTPKDLFGVAVDEVLWRFENRGRSGLQSESFQGQSLSFVPNKDHFSRMMRVIEHYRVYPTPWNA